MDFKLTSEFEPTGDQPKAIAQLTEGVKKGEPVQVLLGATGTGKTFTMANVIKNTGKPALGAAIHYLCKLTGIFTLKSVGIQSVGCRLNF